MMLPRRRVLTALLLASGMLLVVALPGVAIDVVRLQLGALEGEGNVGFLRCDQRQDNRIDPASGKEVPGMGLGEFLLPGRADVHTNYCFLHIYV